MRLSRGVLLLVGVAALGVWADKAASSQAAGVFGNATYRMGSEHVSWMATLVDGVHNEPYLHVRYDDRYVYGDFNDDGLRDAAVIVIENNGGQAHWYHLVFLINDGVRLVHTASRCLDDSAIINSVREKDGKVAIDMFIHRENDCRAGPTKRVENTYAYEGPDRWGPIEASPYQRIYAESTQALQGIYQTPIPTQIRRTFDRAIGAPQTCPVEWSAFTVREGRESVGIFSKPFIVIDIGPSESGGLSATLVFEDAMTPFLLEIDDLGGGRHAVRRMTELPGLLGDGFVRQLQHPAYSRYWMRTA